MAVASQTILVSGASVAGSALAYWLDQYGFRVTMVEKAGAFRGGGYPIDIRGTALQVTDRMGITGELRAAHVDTRRISFYDESGRRLGSVRPDSLSGGVEGRDIEVPRGRLVKSLTNLLSDDVELIFNDSVTAIDERNDQVDVTFASGRQREFGLVIGTDGLHSNIRRLVFGPEEQCLRDLGFHFVGFSVPNDLGLAHEAMMWNAPGKVGSLLCPGDSDTLHGFLMFTHTHSPPREQFDPATVRRLVASTFAGAGWEIPRMVEAMRTAEDLFFDVVSQIHLPAWSRGRVALAGDAAHAPSFLSGQGSSIALVGAYLLAGELAAQPDHTDAFAAYERRARQFVEMNQALANSGKRTLAPSTRLQLWIRNQALRLAPLLAGTGLPGRQGRIASSALDLPAYDSSQTS